MKKRKTKDHPTIHLHLYTQLSNKASNKELSSKSWLSFPLLSEIDPKFQKKKSTVFHIMESK